MNLTLNEHLGQQVMARWAVNLARWPRRICRLTDTDLEISRALRQAAAMDVTVVGKI